MPRTDVAVTHNKFCSEFRRSLADGYVLVEGPTHSRVVHGADRDCHLPSLVSSVKTHFTKVHLSWIVLYYPCHDQLQCIILYCHVFVWPNI